MLGGGKQLFGVRSPVSALGRIATCRILVRVRGWMDGTRRRATAGAKNQDYYRFSAAFWSARATAVILQP